MGNKSIIKCHIKVLVATRTASVLHDIVSLKQEFLLLIVSEVTMQCIHTCFCFNCNIT